MILDFFSEYKLKVSGTILNWPQTKSAPTSLSQSKVECLSFYVGSGELACCSTFVGHGISQFE